ncbi:MAG: PqqD family protein [Cyanobacteria bacterium J06633_1]
MNNNKKLTLKSTITVSESQASSELLGETVILELQSGVYYGLNETGSLIWELLQSGKSLVEIQEIILAEYDIEPEACTQYIIKLIGKLAAKGLVEVDNEAMV